MIREFETISFLENGLKCFYEKLCITVHLYHNCFKCGSIKFSKTIYSHWTFHLKYTLDRRGGVGISFSK